LYAVNTNGRPSATSFTTLNIADYFHGLDVHGAGVKVGRTGPRIREPTGNRS
jgi:hypothetical protein